MLTSLERKSLFAILAYLLLHQGDGMGFLSFDAQMQDYLPISKRMSNFGALLQFLQSPLRSGTTSLQKSLESILPTLKRRCLILLISDFLERQDDLHQALARLSHARHEIMAFHVLSPKELDFPWEEYGEFVDMESGQSLAVEGRTIQATYAARLKEFLQITEGLMRQHKADYQLMSTAHPLRKALHHFLYRRSRQV